MISTPISNLAYRYARALYSLADTQEAQLAMEKTLTHITEFYNEHREVHLMCNNTVLPAGWRADLFLELAGTERNTPVARLVAILVERRRLSLLPEIKEAWRALHRAATGILQVLIETPMPIQEDERQALTQRLTNILGKQVEPEWTVKPDLLGGMVLYYEGRMLDGSIQGRLKAAREFLLAQQAGIA